MSMQINRNKLSCLLSLLLTAALLFHSDTQILALVKNEYDPTTLVFPSFLHTMGIRKATKWHLMVYTKNRVKVRDPQGLAIVRLQTLDDPKTTKDDDEVTGYGVNSGQDIIVYNKSMTSLGFYGRNEKGQKRLDNPTGVAANDRGDVYVIDTGNHRLIRLFNSGKSLKFVRAIGGKGSLPGLFLRPRGVAMDAHGMVYVADFGNHRIQVIRPDDKLHVWFGQQGVEDGQLWHPTGVAATNGRERWSHFKDAFLAVIDLDGQRLQKFTLDGKLLGAVHLQELGFSKGEMNYLALDYYSNIWVTDRVNNCIHKFDRNLVHLTSFGRKGSGNKEFNEPRGIAIHKRFGQVFIAEKESAQYYWIGTDILHLKSSWNPEPGLSSLTFFLTEPSYITLTVEDKDSGSKQTLFERVKYDSAAQEIILDGYWHRVPPQRAKNAAVATAERPPGKPGSYVLKLKVEPTYSSINYFAKEVETSLSIP